MKVCRTATLSLLGAASLLAQQPLTTSHLQSSLSTNKNKVTASSHRDGYLPTSAFDGDLNSAWQSGPPLPALYTEDANLNQISDASLSSPGSASLAHINDGDLNSAGAIEVKNGLAKLIVALPASRYLQTINVKSHTGATINLLAFDKNGQLVFNQSIDGSRNYRLQEFPINQQVKSIELRSSQRFDVFELAAVGKYIYQDLTIDLEAEYRLDSLFTKLAPDNAIDSVTVAVSADGKSYETVALLSLSSYNLSALTLDQVTGRYLRYRAYFQPKDWASVTIYEALVFGEVATVPPSPAWDPYAGVNEHHLPISRVDVTSESANEPKGNLIDGNNNQAWQSTAPLPDNFYSHPGQNVLLGSSISNVPSATDASKLHRATDGIIATDVQITTPGRAHLEITFPNPIYLGTLSFNGLIGENDSLEIFAVNQNNSWLKQVHYTKSDNYQTRSGLIAEPVQKIILRASGDFKIREIAATGKNLSEDAVIDLGTTTEVAYIQADYNGDSGVDSVVYFTSTDSLNWEKQLSFSPNFYGVATHTLEEPVQARYIMARGYVLNQNYKGFNLGELKVYSGTGIYGPMPNASANDRPLGEIMGVNGIWGWGNNKYSDDLDSTVGPGLFSRVATHARNYQNMWWDTDDPDNTPDYANMDLRLWWLDWDREYAAWDAAGIDVDVTLQFLSAKYPAERWDNPEKAAYDYGYAFARHFGPTYGNGLVKLFEIGNEPWYYEPSFYEKVLYHMARGVRDGDPNLPLFPCALQSHEISRAKNFIGTHMAKRSADLLDGLNVHAYSYMYDAEQAARISTYPENPLSGMRSLVQEVKFRDANMPGKKIIVSEWGWDSKGYGLDCEHDECVSAKAQSDYAVRGLLYLDRLGVDQATWFFFGDSPEYEGLYARSGLTVDGSQGNYPHKKSFKAWESIKSTLGDYYFSRAIKEDRKSWIFEYADASGQPAYLVAWLPIDADDLRTENVQISYPYQADSTFIVDGADYSPTSIANPGYSGGKMNLKLQATPILIKLDNPAASKKSSAVKAKTATEVEWKAELYPNPSNGDFKVSLPSNSGTVSYQIFDLAGALISAKSAQSVSSKELSINMSQLREGQYFIELKFENEGKQQSAKLPFIVL